MECIIFWTLFFFSFRQHFSCAYFDYNEDYSIWCKEIDRYIIVNQYKETLMMMRTIKSNEELLTFDQKRKTRSINVYFIVSQIYICRNVCVQWREKREKQTGLDIVNVSIIILLISLSLFLSLVFCSKCIHTHIYTYM